MSGQSRSRDKSELVQRAKAGGGLPGRLPVRPSGAIFPGQQGSFRWAGPALGASPAELRASHSLSPSATLTAAGT